MESVEVSQPDWDVVARDPCAGRVTSSPGEVASLPSTDIRGFLHTAGRDCGGPLVEPAPRSSHGWNQTLRGGLRVADNGQPMWIFTKHGFLSAVCARKGLGGSDQPVDPGRIMVRARVQAHLAGLKNRFPELLGQCEIREFAGTDYAFRIFVAKSVWSQGR